MNEIDKCINFLENNGWERKHEDKMAEVYFDKSECFSVGLDPLDHEMIFFDDSGDIYHCKINIYTLIGFLIHHRQISCNYIYRGFK
jgi:hypothetical protein